MTKRGEEPKDMDNLVTTICDTLNKTVMNATPSILTQSLSTLPSSLTSSLASSQGISRLSLTIPLTPTSGSSPSTPTYTQMNNNPPRYSLLKTTTPLIIDPLPGNTPPETTDAKAIRYAVHFLYIVFILTRSYRLENIILSQQNEIQTQQRAIAQLEETVNVQHEALAQLESTVKVQQTALLSLQAKLQEVIDKL